MEPILCPWCGHEMTLVHLTGWFPPDIRNRYTCLHCMADAPCGTDEQDAYEKARRRRNGTERHGKGGAERRT